MTAQELEELSRILHVKPWRNYERLATSGTPWRTWVDDEDYKDAAQHALCVMVENRWHVVGEFEEVRKKCWKVKREFLKVLRRRQNVLAPIETAQVESEKEEFTGNATIYLPHSDTPLEWAEALEAEKRWIMPIKRWKKRTLKHVLRAKHGMVVKGWDAVKGVRARKRKGDRDEY